MKRALLVFRAATALGFASLGLVLGVFGLGPCGTGSEFGDSAFIVALLMFFGGLAGLGACGLAAVVSFVNRKLHRNAAI